MSEDVEQLIEGAAAVREGSADGTAAWFSAASLGPLLKRQVAPVVSFTIGRKGSGVSSLNHLVDIEFGVPPDGAHGMKINHAPRRTTEIRTTSRDGQRLLWGMKTSSRRQG